MSNKIGADLSKIKLNVRLASGEMVDVKDLPYEQLVYIRLQLENDSAVIEAQLGSAKSSAYTDGVYSDTAWFHSAQSALAFKKRQMHMIQMLMGLRRREDKSKHRESVSQNFVDICRKEMNKDLFMRIMNEAATRGKNNE